MTISKIRVDNTDHELRAKYLVPSSEITPTERSITSGTSGVSQDMGEAVATVQKIKGNTYVDTANNILVGTTATAIKSVGFNQWDEQWEVGTFDSTTGAKKPANNTIRSKNFIKVLPNTIYYASLAPKIASIYYYGNNQNFLSFEYNTSGTRTTPVNCYYIMFVCTSSYGTIYNNDICINISDTSRNGTYEPYKQSICNLNITTLKGKLNGTGSSVTIFSDGMKLAGSYDELTSTKATKRIGALNLGSLTYTYSSSSTSFTAAHGLSSIAKHGAVAVCARYVQVSEIGTSTPDKRFAFMSSWSGYNYIHIRDTAYTNATTFKNSLSGVYLFYELATSEEYILDTPLNLSFASFYGGTESVLPVQSPTITSAPLDALISYSAGDVQALMGSQAANISNDSLKNLLDAMVTAGVISAYTMVYNADTGKYDFTVT